MILIFKQLISMTSHQRSAKKDFSLSQYYSQLEKYQLSSTGSKFQVLKKDSSTSSFSKDPIRTNQTSKIERGTKIEKSKISLNQKYSFEKANTNWQPQKQQKKLQERKFNSYLTDSLANSKLSIKKMPTENNYAQKQNLTFTQKQQRTFSDHCVELYQLKSSASLVQEISKQINKRDQVYQLVSQQFPQQSSQKYCQSLTKYFEQHQLLKKIISEFKKVSKLDIQDLNELYYFLKSDH